MVVVVAKNQVMLEVVVITLLKEKRWAIKGSCSIKTQVIMVVIVVVVAVVVLIVVPVIPIVVMVAIENDK